MRKVKLTVAIDEEVIPRVGRPEGAFSQRWRGKFQPADRKDERYKALAKRFL